MELGTGKNSRSDALAGFVHGLCTSNVPADVLNLARLHLLDSIGLAVVGMRTDFARSTLQAVATLGDGTAATVIGTPVRLPPQHAALANGVAIHAEDFDDTAFKPTIHPSSVIVPAALALGEKLNAGADDVLVAMTAGYEVILRLGMAAPGRFLAHGFHATSVCGMFGAAAVAASLIKLSAEQTMRAFGVAGSMSSGVVEYLGDGSSMKRFHPGWAAMGGISAALYAAAGVDGPRYIFEGKHGLFRSFLGNEAVDIDSVTRGLGTSWLTRDIAFKMYPMCHFIHAFADCMLELRERHQFAADQIAAIRCFISPEQVAIVCEPIEHKRAPRTAYEAKFSMPYVMAAALIDGGINLGSFASTQVQRDDVRKLATRVDYVEDTQSRYPVSFSGRVEVLLQDGRRFEAERDSPRGGPDRPPGETELAAKFADNVASSGVELDTAALLALIRKFQGDAPVRQLMQACAPLY